MANIIFFITGLPCTGKTFIGKQIAVHFSFPYIFKDGIKECLFDSLGWSDRAWSKRIGIASYALLFYFAEALLEARQSFVLESNFSADRDAPKLKTLQNKYGFRAIEIQCVTNGDVLTERFRLRWESGRRHPGHVDPEMYEELRPSLEIGRCKPLGLEGVYFEVDTTDFAQVDIQGILQKINLFVG